MKVKNNWFFYLIIIAIAFKLSIFLFTAVPLVSPDSGGYIGLARNISSFNLSGYVGIRTPGYPLIIALCNMNLTIVVVVQMVLGIFISLLMFKITYTLTSNPQFAFISALTYLFYVQQFDIERFILSETVTTFFVTAAVYFSIVYFFRGKLFYKMLISVLLGCFAALTKPLLILLPFFLIIIFTIDVLYYREKLITLLLRLPILLLLSITSITSWSYVNYKNNQVFTLSTLSGLGMTNAVGGFMIPRNDQFKEIRDIYIKHRTIQINKTGSYVNTIFQAFPEMQQETGLNYASLSVQLQKMSKLEISEQPKLYIRHIVGSVYRFWNPLAEREFNKLYNLKLLPGTIGRVIILILNVLFIISLPLLLLLIYKKQFDYNTLFILIGVYLFVWGSSIAQGMVEYGNLRYSLPFQPITSCFAIIFTLNLFSVWFKASEIPKTIDV